MPGDPTVQEAEELLAELQDSGAVSASFELSLARLCNWDRDRYQVLYSRFVRSVEDDTLTPTAKGDRLEELIRFFLERGGLCCTPVTGLGLAGRWQVDGFGELHSGVVSRVFGLKNAPLLGAALYMEAKNHTKAIGSDEFRSHCDRMQQAEVSCGLAVSTAGFRFGNSAGFARRVFADFRDRNHRVHLLLTPTDLARSLEQDTPPLSVLRTSFLRTTTQRYEVKEVQAAVSEAACLSFIRSERKRIEG